MKKRSVVLLLTLVLTMFAVPVFAAPNDGIRVEYDGFGRVEVDFARNVRYTNPQVSVQDATGATLPAIIRDLDEDDLDFIVENLTPGGEYTFTITGLNGETESVTGSFRVPAEGEIAIKSYDYDGDDQELEVEFAGKVEYDQPTVSIQDTAGNVYEAEIRERDRDSVEMRVRGLQRGAEYTITISGLRLPDFANTVSVTGSFTAR